MTSRYPVVYPCVSDKACLDIPRPMLVMYPKEINPQSVGDLWAQCLGRSVKKTACASSIPSKLYIYGIMGVECTLNPFRMKTPKYLFPRGNKPLFHHQIGNTNFFIFHYKSVKTWCFCVDKIKYEHLAILSNLKSCQFAPRIVIFNLCICCQFEDSQIISPKIIPVSHHNI